MNTAAIQIGKGNHPAQTGEVGTTNGASELTDARLRSMPAPAHVNNLQWQLASLQERRELVTGGGGSEGFAGGVGADDVSSLAQLGRAAQQRFRSVHVEAVSGGSEVEASGDSKEQSALDDITSRFKQRFADMAGDKEAFHDLMRKTYGDSYDATAAEGLRQKALNGDFSWLPKVELVDASVLTDVSGTQGSGEALGAYSKDTDTVYLSRELLASDPAKAEKILTEEIGHAIDTRVNVRDAKGDEGDLFARQLYGEKISAAELKQLKQENDSGVINVNGKMVEVEYGLFSFIKKKIIAPAVDFVKDKVIKPVVKHVIEPVVELGKDVAGIVVNGVETVVDIGKTVFSGGRDVLKHLFRGEFSEAGKAVVNTVKEVAREGVGYVVETVAMTLNAAVNAVESVLGTNEKRGITAEEEAYLRTIYGDSIDYDKVNIYSGGIKNSLGISRAHVVGNDIYMPEGREYDLQLLSHEMGHVWQFQNRGAGYISDALHAQITEGNAAYDWQSAVESGVSFDDMNPEQQAQLARDIGIVLNLPDSGGRLTLENFQKLPGLNIQIEEDEYDIIIDAQQRLFNG